MITGITHKDDYQVVSKQEPWQKKIVTAIKDPLELLGILGLSNDKHKKELYLSDKFKLFVPLSYVLKMEKGDWNDPLLKQVLPLSQEAQIVSGFNTDPVGDSGSEISSGVLQKYQGRVLLITTGACAVHCRYCFRRHFPYAESLSDKKNWEHTVSIIKNDKSLTEIILSGGDPLMLSDDKLKKICFELADIPHIKTIRFHTRMPLFIPERIDKEFLSWTAKLPLQKVMVIHANHANELDQVVNKCMKDLREAGFTLLNQSVLLKGVNDNLSALSDLSHKLFSMQVIPYYLHQLDRVQGAAHFEVDKDEAICLLDSLKNHLPGYLVPRLVAEISGKRSKQALV